MTSQRTNCLDCEAHLYISRRPAAGLPPGGTECPIFVTLGDRIVQDRGSSARQNRTDPASPYATFYESLRWPGWQGETRDLHLTHGIAVHPFLWSSQARHDLAATHRNPVPLHELFLLHHDFAERLAALPDRTPVQIDFT